MPRRPIADPSQLALFGDVPAPTPTQSDPAQGAPAASAAAPSGGLTPATFGHPRGTRESRLGGHRVTYELRRARRRSIGFAISLDGLTVSAPRWVTLADVEAALQEKSAWILRKLQEQDERGRRLAAARVDWRDGTSIPFLGETAIIVLDPRTTGSVLHDGPQLAALAPPEGGSRGLGRPGAVLHTSDDTLPGVPRLTLHVGLPQSATPVQIRDAVQSWLQRQARRVFEDRCRHFASQLGVRMTRLSLSSASTRWGSAGADGAIRLNWRLIHFAMPSIDYVVAHELAHLREMNHSAAFWDVVRSVMPDFERARGALCDDVLPVLD